MIPPSLLPDVAACAARTLLAPGVVGSGAHAIDPASWGALEWAAYASMALVCVWVLWRAVRTTLHPGETQPDHVKRSILDDDTTPFGPAPGAGRPPRASDAVPPHP